MTYYLNLKNKTTESIQSKADQRMHRKRIIILSKNRAKLLMCLGVFLAIMVRVTQFTAMLKTAETSRSRLKTSANVGLDIQG
ncbi:hypothetical protein L596_012543 [Steinernema carpocapsae]|uniref:Uncharacterized protein n=1 Tax=Steinernema carpocapsae TaxID=34508 RepID=A0A4V6A4V4_STECR|nr:hypothetical protein L596_012543 [Steinernema carpocapsae]